MEETTPTQLHPDLPTTAIPETTVPPTPPVEPTTPTPPATPPTQEPSSPMPSAHFPIRTALLIFVLAILAGGLLFLAIKQTPKPAEKTTVMQVPTPTTKPAYAHTLLSLVQTPSSQSATNSVSVMIDTKTNQVNGVQFEIVYDPAVLTNVAVLPGTFFVKPLELLKSVDPKNGKINYAIGVQPTALPISGTGTVATITYTIAPNAKGTTELKFLPKTQVVQEGEIGSALDSATNLTLSLDAMTSQPTRATSSAGQ
ncbi:MAG TPA: cohesin domain-containing protein [Patescibacteria group bacterium]|nr:cohesin domain-containing protein [Patescibacteria group bacterium]